ncbi:hypothetical protein ACFQY5_30640 [Paeniroseomonas aquatica]|uniref:hypothetical protein n=1 Tax=Paeniroseomonas aquatica TaxID=373043 RepID=UPI0036078B10
MHIRPLRLLWPALAVAAWIGGLRAETACFYGYEGFEENVRHVNLDRCPGKDWRRRKASAAWRCRATRR